MSTSPTASKEPAISIATLPGHRELAASITVNPDRLAAEHSDRLTAEIFFADSEPEGTP